MSKERLEEIIKQIKRSDEYAEKGLWSASDKKIVNLHNEGHINLLVERVQELEQKVRVDSELFEKQVQQNKQYREAIEKLHDIIGARASDVYYTRETRRELFDITSKELERGSNE